MNWESFYLVCFGVGLCLSVVCFFGGLGHLHLGHFHLGHGHTVHMKSGLSLFNGFSLLTFLCWFGGIGYLLTRHGSLIVPVVLLIAAASGLFAAALVAMFLVKVLLPRERALLPEDTEMRGVVARVISKIRPHGTGEILFSLDGSRRCAAARMEDGNEAPRNTQVLVLRYERGIAWVRPWTELDDLEITDTPT